MDNQDNQRIWKTVLENLRMQISTANFATWFPRTFIHQIKEIDTERLIAEIGCPSEFARNTIENRYYGLVKSAIDQATEKKCDLVFVIKQQSTEPQSGKDAKLQSKGTLFEERGEEEQKAGRELTPEAERALQNAGLRKDFNFETLAVSSSNQMAYAAATAVADNPGYAYNPLFLYGGVGVGKTHLAQAIAQTILIKDPKAKIIYCVSEDFTNEIVEAIRTKNTQEFKNKYRTVKVLLIDDIQFIAGKSAVQEEFFHTFNALTRKGGQIIMTADRRPDEIAQLEDRLRSRFEGGLMIDIQQPNFELRTAILLIKAKQRRMELPMDAAQLIAGNITSTRGLEGFLTRLSAETATKGGRITPELVSALLGQKNDNNHHPSRLVKPREVISAVAAHYNLKINELTGKCRAKPIVVPRQILMYLLRIEFRLSLMEVARHIGGRDHTTIMHGVEKITKLLPESEDMRVDIAGIKQRLYG